MRVVNLYGGPGTGKSTTAALVFGALKQKGINAELVTEYAKDLVWENRRTLACQPYVFGKQLWRVERLRDQVDVVVTDSPLMLSTIYAKDLGPNWMEFVYETHLSFETLDVFLERDNFTHPFKSEGRTQATVEEASLLDNQVYDMLCDFSIPFITVSMGDTDHVGQIVSLVLS